MNKTDLIQEITEDLEISKKDATVFLDSLQETIIKILKKGEDINIIEFGSFKIVKTLSRIGRNPQTGKEIKIKAGKRVKFRMGRGLKDSVK
jgi:DNA-binding protein HU-beta